MNMKFDLCLALAIGLSILAVWQFYSLVSDWPMAGRRSVEIASGPSASSLTRAGSLGN
jgi:hypothetical protein